MATNEDPGATPRRPTIQDVADAAGVSRALVSIVFRDVPGASEATRERVRAVAEELGYRPDRRAQLLRQRRTRTIGVSFGVRHAFHGDLVESLYRIASERGFSLTLSATTTERSDAVAAESLLSERTEAIVLLGTVMSETALAAVGASVPTVVVTRSTGGRVDAVHTDDREGGRLGASHLLDLGHRTITYLNSPASAGADARLLGVQEAVAAAGGQLVTIDAGADEESGIRAATALLGGEQPTAVFAFNDSCALGVLDTFLRAGVRVPEDVSVIGYDDSRIAQLPVVDLTTIAQDADGLARRALDLAIDRIDRPGAPAREEVLVPSLVVRGTTAKARAAQAPAAQPAKASWKAATAASESPEANASSPTTPV